MNVLILGLGDDGLQDPASEPVRRHLEYARRAGGRIELIADTRNQGVTDHGALTVYRTGASRLGYLAAVRRILPGILRRGSPDLITSQDPFGTAQAGLWLRRSLRRPLVIQNHSSFLFNPYWLREKPFLFRLLHWMAQSALPRADAWRVVNARERRVYVMRLGLPEDRVRVLPVPCDLAPFRKARESRRRDEIRRRIGADAKAPVIVWAGRPVRVKRLPVLHQAFAQVRGKIPGARLWLCGDPSALQEDLAFVADKPTRDAARWLGPLGREELAETVAAADVFALSSAYEGFGRVLVEAATGGVPAVATATAGAEDIIVEGRTGRLAPIESAEGLAAGLIDLLRDAPLRKKMGQAAAERAEERFDPDRAFAAIVEHWREVAEGGMRG